MREDLVIFVWKNGIIELDQELHNLCSTDSRIDPLSYFHSKIFVLCSYQFRKYK